MLFKFITVATAFASVVSASAVSLEARQVGGLATCQIRTTPSSTPNPASGLLEEFIQVINREFSNDIGPGTGIVTGSTSFTGPSGGAYTVNKTIGAITLTPEQTRNVLRAWAGQTFPGAGNVGVATWTINAVTC